MSQEPPTRAVEATGPPVGRHVRVEDPPVVADELSSDVPSDGAGGAGGPGDSDGSPDGSGPAPPSRHRRSARRWIVEWVVIILVAVGVAFGVRTYVAQTYYVPSTSMYPTLKAGDRIVVNKLFGGIHTGEIIVFKRPPAEECGGPTVPDLVKRVIGLPGQTVSAKGGQVYITGKLLKEPWLPTRFTGKKKKPVPLASENTTMTGPKKVPQGDYFVMGDNRVDSCDSRIWGPVKGSYIVGQVFLIIWPLSQFRFF